MKSLTKRILALPAHSQDAILPAAFYLEHGFTTADAGEMVAQWFDLELAEQEEDVSDSVLLHAWSILAVLGGKEGREFLIDELGISSRLHDDFYICAFPDLMLATGPDAVPELIAVLENGRDTEGTLMELATALSGFARSDIEREAVLKALVSQLRGDPRHRSLKGFVIGDLIELSGDTYLPEIRKAFDENLVDVSIDGDLEEVEIKLGLREKRSGPQPHWSEMEASLVRESRLRELGPRPEEGDDQGIILYFLKLHRGPGSVGSLAEFDGLMLGTILAPTMVMPSRWLPAIWDPENRDHDPKWDCEEDAELFLTAVMNWHNGIIRRLDEGTYSPPLEPRTDLRVPSEDELSWARGLIGSVMSWESGTAQSSEIHQALMASAIHLINPSDDTPDNELIQVDHVVRAAHMTREARRTDGELPPFSDDDDSVGGYPTPEIETYEREAPKTGRNDPCPCGSGLKYKRCCMN